MEARQSSKLQNRRRPLFDVELYLTRAQILSFNFIKYQAYGSHYQMNSVGDFSPSWKYDRMNDIQKT
jgi:hypothetical protein